MKEIKNRKGIKPGKGIKKRYTMIQETRQLSDISELENQCECTHQDHGVPTIKRVGTGNGGEPLFKCYMCGKPIRLNNITVEEIEQHVAFISQAIDIIKISTNLRNDENIKRLNKLAKVQKRLPSIPKLFAAVTRPSKKKQREGGGSVWKG